MDLVVFSICKDEAETIGKLLDRIPKNIEGIKSIRTLVISDGSSDKTVEQARLHGATEIIEGKSQKRLAFRFEEAVEKSLDMGADIAVSIDGDLQFKPEDIPKLVKPIVSEHYDFVAADRFTDPRSGKRRKPQGMPSGKYLANRVGSWITSKLSQRKFKDVTCGFRAYNRNALFALNINSPYTYTQESFQLLAAKRLDIKAVPIEVTYYKGRKSRVVVSFFGFLFTSALNILRAFRDFAPLKFFGLIGGANLFIGFIMIIFTLIHWLQADQFSPYKFVGLAGIYFVSLGLILVSLGLVADMFNRTTKNQEKIIERMKRNKYSKSKE